MNYNKYIKIFLFFPIIFPLIVWNYREYFKDTFVADVYIYCLRSEKPFDDQHVITSLSGSEKKIIVNTEDRCVSRSIRIVGYWEKKNSEVIKRLVKPGQTILEVGANYGYYTLNFAHWLKGKGKIIAYEASPFVFKYLEQSVKLNEDQGFIQLMPVAASNKIFQSYLVHSPLNIGGGYIVTPESPEFEKCKESPRCLPIKSSIIDNDLHDIDHVDLLKIDAEGSEIPALMGAEKLIDRSPNLIIVMEWIPSQLKKFGSVNELLRFLTDKGFKFWAINQEKGGINSINPQDLPNHPSLELVVSRQDLKL